MTMTLDTPPPSVLMLTTMMLRSQHPNRAPRCSIRAACASGAPLPSPPQLGPGGTDSVTASRGNSPGLVDVFQRVPKVAGIVGPASPFNGRRNPGQRPALPRGLTPRGIEGADNGARRCHLTSHASCRKTMPSERAVMGRGLTSTTEPRIHPRPASCSSPARCVDASAPGGSLLAPRGRWREVTK